ncbi:MAG: DUF167 domain-containing protein [Hyphomonadaceae bacterium]|nr:DUF167 domain-containing protein [Hyphomonadaceae bacterium]
MSASAELPGFAARTRDGVRLRVRVTPKASEDRIDGAAQDASGAPHLQLRVRAAPENGAANAAVEALLAKRLGVPRSRVHVAKGATARVKMVDIAGLDAASLKALIR